MRAPLFSIAIPTKNRPAQLADAVRSVLEQTFADFEVVVCDNSDESEAARSAERVGMFDDARLRYVRTDGKLSMPDNWERAVSEARGEFVGILTDRSVFRRDALSVIEGEIASTGAKCISWFNDLYARDEASMAFKRRDSTFRRHRLESRAVLDYFVSGHPKYAPKIIPKLMTAVCHRSVLSAIRTSAVGRCCPPVAPDFGSGFLILAHCDSVLVLDEALYVSCGYGTGSAFRRRGELGDRFRRDLGMTWEALVDRMPTNASFSHALVLNDFMRIREALPDQLGGVAFDRAQYYVGCLTDYVKAAKRGVTERDDDVDILLDGLARESVDVRELVEATRTHRQALQFRAHRGPGLGAKVTSKMVTMAAGKPQPVFATVFDALAWDESNPRVRVAETFLDRLPMIEAEVRTKPARNGGLRSDDGSSWPQLWRAGLGGRLRRLTRRG